MACAEALVDRSSRRFCSARGDAGGPGQQQVSFGLGGAWRCTGSYDGVCCVFTTSILVVRQWVLFHLLRDFRVDGNGRLPLTVAMRVIR